MRLVVSVFISQLFLLISFPAAAQSPAFRPDASTVKSEQEKFVRHLKTISYDSNVVFHVARYVELKTDSILKEIEAVPFQTSEKKVMAIRSLITYIRNANDEIADHKLQVYDLLGLFDSYSEIYDCIVRKKQVEKILKDKNAWECQLLARAFWQYDEASIIDKAAVFKRVVSKPEFILDFLETQPSFKYADSLLLIAAANDPLKMMHTIQQDKPALHDLIWNNQNLYFREIVALAKERNAEEFLPFTIPLAEGTITPEQIIEKRMDSKVFFQFLVDMLKDQLKRPATHPSMQFQKTMRVGVREKALAFYVYPVNELHSSPDAVRFEVLKELRPEDFYYIITNCEDEMFTSSYLGLYKRLMDNFGEHFSDSLFTIVNNDNFRIFMRIAANYNTLTDFLYCMPEENAGAILKRFISGIEVYTETGVEKAMDIADSFTGLSPVNGLSELVQKELTANLERCRAERSYFGVRLYTILLQVYDLVKYKDPDNMLWKILGNYEVLRRKSLLNWKGEINEIALFYGDDDGISSFNNFLSTYKDAKKWEIIKNNNWVRIRSRADKPISIYANLPLDEKEELDMKAQDSLFAYLNENGIEPTILIHRGHSYHLKKTMSRMNPSVRLAILGSCGGYNSIISVAKLSPGAQIIVSKKTGSMAINDPLIDEINQNLENQGDLVWADVWAKLKTRFISDPNALGMFYEYLPPSKNVSLFVLKLFNMF